MEEDLAAEDSRKPTQSVTVASRRATFTAIAPIDRTTTATKAEAPGKEAVTTTTTEQRTERKEADGAARVRPMGIARPANAKGRLGSGATSVSGGIKAHERTLPRSTRQEVNLPPQVRPQTSLKSVKSH